MDTLDGADLCFPHLNSSCRKPDYVHPLASLVYVVLTSISVLTVALNLLVIVSISHFRQLHTPTNLLLLSLAISDLLVGFVLMPVEILYTETCWFFSDMLCTLYYVADYTLTSAAVASMVLISVDRYVAVCDPLRYAAKVNLKTTQLSVSLCWLCSVFYRSLLLNDHFKQPGRSNSCLGECVVVIDDLAGVVDLVFTFVIPTTIIVVLYMRVFLVASSQARAMRRQVAAASGRRPGTVKKAEVKAARTLGVVIVMFLVCFCPYYFPSLAGKDTSVDAASVAVEIWLTHFNSCINPVIYALFYPWFRKSVKLIVTLQILKSGSSDAKVL